MLKDSFNTLIFDMDGTLWDAVDTYCEIWNETYRRIGYDRTVSRQELLQCMGMPLPEITARIAPADMDIQLFTKTLREVDSQLMPTLGGRLYDGVAKYIPLLAQHYRLMMVSNCGPHGLDYFMQYTGLGAFFTDTLTNGQTRLPKSENIRILLSRWGDNKAIYIGDTQSDCDQAHLAGIPMLHLTYGFGTCIDAEYSANSFSQLSEMFLL